MSRSHRVAHILLPLALATMPACGGSTSPVSSPGHLRVTATTTGQAMDANGYTIAIGNRELLPLDANASLLVEDLPVGQHTVEVSGVAGNCALAGTNPRTVTVVAGSTTEVSLAVDCALMHPAGTIAASVEMTGRPYGVAISRAGLLYVSFVGSNTLRRGELETRQLGSPVIVGAFPARVAFAPDDSRVYWISTDISVAGDVSVATNTVGTTIPLEAAGVDVIVSPDGSRLYATDAGGRVYAVNTATNAVIGEPLVVGPSANGLAIAPAGDVLYVTSRDAGTISAVSTTTFEIARTYTIGGTPQHMAVSPDGTTLYVTDEQNELAVVDVATGDFTKGAAGPAYGVAITPDGEQLYVLSPMVGSVFVFDRETLDPVKTIATGGDPRHVAFGHGGAVAVITTEEAVVYVH